MIVLLATCLGIAGCGGSDLPPLGDVEGTVTMDGQPLPNVTVQFHSNAGGRPGSGVTDKDGKFKLTYLDGATGSKVGPSKVEITTFWPDGEPGPGQKETVPEKYNSKSTLSADVKPGKNTFDFPLTSK